MSEFSFDRTSDWDLHAVVKGRSITTTTNTMYNIMPSYDAWIESLSNENEAVEFNELQQLSCESSSTISPQKIVDSSSSMMMSFDLYTKSPTHEPKEKPIDNHTRAITISKRRKNKHKIIKVVQQEGGDRVLCDKWNWRKYGEKVIKGSPYPRSYYRCSYPGGCSARKQVEQSTSDPGLFLITYMEEHNHPYPTRRHSQAGRSARRFNNNHATSKAITTNESQNTLNLVRSSTNLEPSLNNDGVFALRGDDDDGSAGFVGENDDFFAGLDYLEGLHMDFYN